MKDLGRMRLALILLAAFAAIAVFSGCGDNNSASENAKTGEGAKPGATGDQAGGFAVEAGKKRHPSDVQQEKQNFSSEPPPVQILSGDQTGIVVSKPTAYLVKSGKEFNALMKRHFSHGVKKQAIAPTDWKTRQHIGVFMPRSKKGTLITVVDVYEDRGTGTVVVKVAELTPGKGCGVPKYRPRPFHIVETRKMASNKTKVNVEKQPNSTCK